MVNGQTAFSPAVCTSARTDNAGGKPFTASQKVSGLTTLSHCKAYNSGIFWGNSQGNQHRALVICSMSVAVGLAFSQQVDIAEGSRCTAEAFQSTPRAV